MSNRWGNFCTPSDDELSRGPYPPLHCFTLGEAIGLVLVAESGIISVVALVFVFCLIIRNVRRESRRGSGRRLIQQPMDVFLLSLFVADFCLSMTSSFNIRWVHNGKVEIGTFCRAQATFASLGPTTVALTTLAIAVFTFVQVWWRKGKGKGAIGIAWAIVGVIWIYMVLLILISALHYHPDTYFRPTPYWCWIDKRYNSQRIFTEYLWMFVALFSSVFLYIPLFFLRRGNVTPDPNVWWKLRIHRRDQAVILERDRRRSLDMIAYPLIYTVTIMAFSISRLMEFKQEGSGDHQNHTSASFILITRVIFGLSGVFNVILFLTTRPNLLLLRRPEESERHAPVPTGGNRETAQNGPAGSNLSNTVNGDPYDMEHRSPTGFDESVPDVGNLVDDEFKEMAEALGWELRVADGQSPKFV